jgi:GNAT superfamily N-acetyltransferase
MRVIDALESDDWSWAAEAASDIERELTVETWGWSDLWAPPVVWQAFLSDRTDIDYRLFLAVPDDVEKPSGGDVAGMALVRLPRAGNDHLATLFLAVRAGHRRRGLATTLLEVVEREVAALGRTTIATWVGSSPEAPPGPGSLDAPTGVGRVAADAPSSRFALRNGFALEQVGRHSVLTVPEDLTALSLLRESALAQAGPAYRLHTWPDDIPEEWLAQFAVLLSRMATDAPHAGLDIVEEPWDVERVGRWLRSYADRTLHVTITVAEHEPTATLVGYTVLFFPVVDVPFGFQDDTLVIREHRGHRLGMAMKTTNLFATLGRRPGLRRIHTDNAGENAPMLAINVALGYEPVGVFAAWQKRLPA